ncbi:hypothetical protein U1Q18_039720, partial [Sarracenia purpurea var. burkii]
VLHRSERTMSSWGRDEYRGCGRRRGGALGGGKSSHSRRIPVRGEGGSTAGLVSSP